MTQVARGVGPGAASRPGVALPVRIHDLLLSLAGRLDDDALADARQMLASAELDRSLEFLAGCLAAGRVVLTHEQHAELATLFNDTYLDQAVIDRIMVTDRMNIGRHRFAFGSVEGREPERGVADAVRSVLGVLPDVRSMWCVWRLTPAGPSSGPVPHLLVLVGIGPGGFPPATAYRVEDALRRSGIRASVEVLMDGVEPGEYHREAMRNARQIPFDGPGFNRPRVEPAYEAARIAPARAEATRVTTAPEPPRLEPARVSSVPHEQVHVPPARAELPRAEPVRVEPPRVEPPRAESPHAEPQPRISVVPDLPPAVDAPRLDAEVPLRKDPPFSDVSPAEQTLVSPIVAGPVGDDPPADVVREPFPVELPRVEAVRSDPFAPEPAPQPVRAVEPAPDEPPGMREELRIESRPSPTPLPRRREEPRRVESHDPPSRPRLAPAPAPVQTGGVDKHSQAFVDDILNTQERNLLKELQDELARREQQDPPPANSSGSWRVDRSGRHGKPATAGPYDHPNQPNGPMIINGGPPHDQGYPSAT
ncbi:hypothetical protein [Actinophytocola oryzae]|uniref:Uncharacterized protein n=1 Tax=Actinophytocola oryzae TaxID=502181 RepID=A0A4R7UYM1_9PSEU|nr:hypothetical protein [Actinophytocola oryzae]TDV40635.1 hypothetical protein CLV71_12223 [Actinophytocola oryzae]